MTSAAAVPELPEVLDSTFLSEWKACRFKALQGSMYHWKPQGESIHLHAGAAFAKGLESARHAFYQEGATNDEAEAVGLTSLLSAYGDFDSGDHVKSATRMAEALMFYFTQYPLPTDAKKPHRFASGKLGIEFSFATPLPIRHPVTGNPFIYSGRADMIADFAGGVWLIDDKTTSSLGASWGNQWRLRSQFTSYCWAAREAGMKVEGVIARGVSILKTKFDTQEVMTQRPDWMIEEWLAVTVAEVADLISNWKGLKSAGFDLSQFVGPRPFRKNLSESCSSYGGCSFLDVCTSEKPEVWLPMKFERRRWDPLTRLEEKLGPLTGGAQ